MCTEFNLKIDESTELLDTKEDSLLCGSLYYVGEVLEKWGNVWHAPF